MAHCEHGAARRSAALSVLVVALCTALLCALLYVMDGMGSSPEPEYFGIGKRGANGEVPREPEEVEYEPFYALLIGSDSRKGTALYTGKANEHAQVDQHSDIMTLVRVDPASYTITLVSVPRDTEVSEGGAKINDALLEDDAEDVVAAVEKLTGVNVSCYFMINFIEFENLVDAMGGVVVDVPQTVTVSDPSTAEDVKVSAGKNQLLDGSEALVFSRARKEYGDYQDAVRQRNVRSVEIALMQNVLQGEVSPNRALNLLVAYTESDVDVEWLKGVLTVFVEHADEVQFLSGTGPYEGDYRESDGLWVTFYNKQAWAELMAVVDEGGDPSSVIEMDF